MMNRSLRAAALLLALFFLVGSAFSQLLSPLARGKAMDAIRDKYYALEKQPIQQRRQETAAFAKTLPEILSAQVTEDGNIACLFKDYVPYMILGNVAGPQIKKPDLLNPGLPGPPFSAPVGPASGPHVGVPGPDEPPAATASINSPIARGALRSDAQMPALFEPNDLPESVNARIANALGKCFGDSCPEVRKVLSNKGYTVAPDVDASIGTLMGLRGLGVFYMQCHGGNGLVWDRTEKKFGLEYILVSGEEWSAAKENDMEATVVLGPNGGGLMSAGYLGTCEALYDLDANYKEINKRWFTFTKLFIKTFWKFSKNSFVLVYGCTTTNISDAMADPAVNASVYCGMSDLGHNDCHKWIKLLFDRMSGTNDDANGPAEEFVAQRPFDWVKLFADFKDRKKLWPTVFTPTEGPHKGETHSPSPIFRANRGNFGLLTPTIEYVTPRASDPRIALRGLFGADPGEKNRKVEIANVARIVEEWTPTQIIVLLDDNGKNTAGEVKVYNRGRPSNSRWLSKWTGRIGITISGEDSLALNADFNFHMIGDPWSYRDNPGIKPKEQPVWSVYTTEGSTCTWNASGEEKDSDGKVIRSWQGQGTPSCWVDMTKAVQNTFTVGGVADTFQKKINMYPAIMSTFNLTEQGTPNPKTPIKLGDWMQGQTLFQAVYDSDYGIHGDKRVIKDEPSKLSYGGKNAILIWDSMQCRYGMPRTASR